VSPRLNGPLAQPVVTSARPPSASTVAMAAASTQTQDDPVDICQLPVQNITKVNEPGNQTMAVDGGVRSSEPPPNKSVLLSAQHTAGAELAAYSSGSCNTAQRSSAVSTRSSSTGTAPSFIDRQMARVRPRVLTHVIEGFVIQEANEPFPVRTVLV